MKPINTIVIYYLRTSFIVSWCKFIRFDLDSV